MATTAHSALPVCDWPCYRALQGQMLLPLQCAAGVVEPAPGAAAGLGRWFVGVAVLSLCGDFQRRRQHSATTAHRALPLCEWPSLGMPQGTNTSNASSVVCSRSGGACTGGCTRARQVVCGGCGFASEWRFCRGGGSTQQPQRTEHCTCMGNQPMTYHRALEKDQMQPL